MLSKTPLALATASLMLLAVAACNRTEPAADTAPAATSDAPPPVAAPMPAPVETPPPATPAMPTQAEALATLNLVNDHEIKAAEQAKSKNVTGDVLAYANMMQAEHTKNMAATKTLLDGSGGAPADTPAMTEMKAKSAAELQQLDAQSGDAYAKAYIDAMVAGHQDVLGKLDTMLIPAATDPAAKAHLQATRDAVQKHFDHAKDLQAKMGAAKPAA